MPLEYLGVPAAIKATIEILDRIIGSATPKADNGELISLKEKLRQVYARAEAEALLVKDLQIWKTAHHYTNQIIHAEMRNTFEMANVDIQTFTKKFVEVEVLIKHEINIMFGTAGSYQQIDAASSQLPTLVNIEVKDMDDVPRRWVRHTRDLQMHAKMALEKYELVTLRKSVNDLRAFSTTVNVRADTFLKNKLDTLVAGITHAAQRGDYQ